MIELYKPQVQDLWFKEKMLSDPETMAYNHAYGGTISFPKERWDHWYQNWLGVAADKRFYRYVKVKGTFVGEVAYRWEQTQQRYLADVIIYAPYRGRGYGKAALMQLCEAARKNGITELYDEIAADNAATALFLQCGFTQVLKTAEHILVKKRLYT